MKRTKIFTGTLFEDGSRLLIKKPSGVTRTLRALVQETNPRLLGKNVSVTFELAQEKVRK